MPRNPLWKVPSTWKSERHKEALPLSKMMIFALISGVDGEQVGANMRTINALHRYDLCDEDGVLNEYGKVIAITKLSLTQQCKKLNIPLTKFTLFWPSRPEPAALEYVLKEGEWGFADEGKMLHALIHSLVLKLLYKTACSVETKRGRFWGPIYGPETARSWFYLHYAGYGDLLEIEPNLVQLMLNEISTWDRVGFLESWRLLRKWNEDNQYEWALTHPAKYIDDEKALATLDAFGKHRILAIAQKIFKDPYSYYSGWPDLMILNANIGPRFVEVKTTDKLHYSQVITISDMKEVAKLDISVLRLTKCKKV